MSHPFFVLRYIDHFDKWLYHSPEDFRHGAVSRLRQEAGFMFVDCCFKTGRLELEASCGVGVFPLDILVGPACLKNRLSLREFPQVFEWPQFYRG